MNFLAHLYLSGNNIKITTGNFMADAIKGNKYLTFEDEIQKGILLHRAIDYYTDHHALVKLSKKRLHQRYNHFNGIIIDIFYDHFLAKNWSHYSAIPLAIYAHEIYSHLEANSHLFPPQVKRMLYFMKLQNWLVSYQDTTEIKKVLTQMSLRSKHQSYMHLASEDLILHYNEFENDFQQFFPDIIAFTNLKIKQL
ncbi:MAG: acyl carrier protein phosphodiesterase [Bacteroidetes bacterium]|nr:acyl carrier protein phosphodiesterase [Bacteroidota bacterium]